MLCSVCVFTFTLYIYFFCLYYCQRLKTLLYSITFELWLLRFNAYEGRTKWMSKLAPCFFYYSCRIAPSCFILAIIRILIRIFIHLVLLLFMVDFFRISLIIPFQYTLEICLAIIAIVIFCKLARLWPKRKIVNLIHHCGFIWTEVRQLLICLKMKSKTHGLS